MRETCARAAAGQRGSGERCVFEYMEDGERWGGVGLTFEYIEVGEGDGCAGWVAAKGEPVQERGGA